MKDERKNIDQLFSEGLGDFKPAPPPEMWEKIGTGLSVSTPGTVSPARNIGRIVLIGVAAVVLTGIALLWYFSGHNNPVQEDLNTIQQTEAPVIDNNQPIVTSTKSAKAETKSAISTEITGETNLETAKQQPQKTETILKIVSVPFADANENSIVKNKGTVKNTAVESIYKEPLSATNENSALITDLRTDFTQWLISQSIVFIPVSATSVFNEKYRQSGKPSLHSKTDIPLIGGVYAAWDRIDYGNNHTKESRALGLSLSTFRGPWLLETGAAVCLSDDNGRFLVNYNSFDSIGYYNKVVSFSLDPNNYGSIQFNTEVQGVFDSIDHHMETKTVNRYTYLQIPLMAGYHFYNNRLFTLSIKAGPIFSVMLNSSEPGINFIRENANLQSIDQLSPSRVSTNWQIAAALGIGLHLSQKLTLQLEPTYKTYLRPVYQGYQTKPQSIGIRAGLLYRF